MRNWPGLARWFVYALVGAFLLYVVPASVASVILAAIFFLWIAAFIVERALRRPPR